jgi:hypothetical protein
MDIFPLAGLSRVFGCRSRHLQESVTCGSGCVNELLSCLVLPFKIYHQFIKLSSIYVLFRHCIGLDIRCRIQSCVVDNKLVLWDYSIAFASLRVTTWKHPFDLQRIRWVNYERRYIHPGPLSLTLKSIRSLIFFWCLNQRCQSWWASNTCRNSFVTVAVNNVTNRVCACSAYLAYNRHCSTVCLISAQV